MAATPNMQKYGAMLRTASFVTETAEHEVRGRVDGRTWVIVQAEPGRQTVSLLFPTPWTIENEAVREQVEHFALAATKGTRAAVVSRVGESWTVVELAHPARASRLLTRGLRAVEAAGEAFLATLHALQFDQEAHLGEGVSGGAPTLELDH